VSLTPFVFVPHTDALLECGESGRTAARAVRRRRTARRLAVGVALTLAAFAAPAQQASPASELRLSVAMAPAFPLGAAAKAWSEAMAAAPEGRVETKLHPGASLAGRDPARELLALRDGAADLAVGSALAWSAQLPGLGVYALPWIAPEPEDLAALVASPEVAGELMRRAEANGVVLLAFAPLGHRSLATTSRTVRAPADLAGLRVRATGGPAIVEALAALGARPEAMSFQLAQEALAAGRLDGQEGFATSFVAARMPATGYRQLLRWGAFGDAMVFAVRRAVWDGWSDAQRRSALDSARRVAAGVDAAAREADAERMLVAQGMGDSRLTRAGHDAFAAAAASARTLRVQAIGADLVATAERVVQASRSSRPAR
jgi:TRAP-type C4-dicarboxylate transport system substrate-binding protein